MSPMLKSTGVGHFGAKFGRKGLIDVSEILTRFGKDMGLPYAKEILLISSAICAQCTNMTDTQTNRPQNGNIDHNRRN